MVGCVREEWHKEVEAILGLRLFYTGGLFSGDAARLNALISIKLTVMNLSLTKYPEEVSLEDIQDVIVSRSREQFYSPYGKRELLRICKYEWECYREIQKAIRPKAQSKIVSKRVPSSGS